MMLLMLPWYASSTTILPRDNNVQYISMNQAYPTLYVYLYNIPIVFMLCV